MELVADLLQVPVLHLGAARPLVGVEEEVEGPVDLQRAAEGGHEDVEGVPDGEVDELLCASHSELLHVVHHVRLQAGGGDLGEEAAVERLPSGGRGDAHQRLVGGQGYAGLVERTEHKVGSCCTHELLPAHGLRRCSPPPSSLAGGRERDFLLASRVSVQQVVETLSDGDAWGEQAVELEGEEELVDLAEASPAHLVDARGGGSTAPLEQVLVVDLEHS
mmetsp:Transcript_28025/g.90918  ORF Transcript_28025/g.90918 Transcript_28025/m.90918 type:complete len:219 (-) Transcript_28025:3369-4025(-)